VTVVIVIACGKGNPEDISEGDWRPDIDDSVLNLTDGANVDSILTKYSSAPITVSSSSVIDLSSSSDISSASGSSSSVLLLSSSGVLLSSSAALSYELSCRVDVDTGTVNVMVPVANRPKVTCALSGTVIPLDPAMDFGWENAPFPVPKELGDYSNIKVKVLDSEEIAGCRGQTAPCSGTFRICPLTGCQALSSSSSVEVSSSSEVASSSSDAESSSSSAAPSSSSVASSSSSVQSSSSVAPPPPPSSSSVTPPPSSSSTTPSGEPVVITSSKKVTLNSSVTQYKCVFASDAPSLFCRLKGSSCSAASTKVTIKLGTNDYELTCYDANNPATKTLTDCDAVGTTPATVRNISIPSSSEIECSTGHDLSQN